MPTAVTWLNKLNDEDRSKCGANLINITSLRLDESKTLSEFLPPVSITKIEEVGKYLDKLTLTLPAREHPNEEVLIITMQFGKAKTKKNKKGMYLYFYTTVLLNIFSKDFLNFQLKVKIKCNPFLSCRGVWLSDLC